MTMIVAWPVVMRHRVVHAFKPGGSSTAEGPFRTLRRHEWVSSGVRVSRHTGRSLAGQLTIFSSLNVIAARLARRGDESAAERMARAAGEVESGVEFALFRRLLEDLQIGEAEQVVDGVLPSSAPPELTDAIRAIAARTEQVKASGIVLSSPAEIAFAGRIAEVHDAFVVLAVSPGTTTMVPRWLVGATKRDQVGAYLALVADKLDGTSALFEAVPAIDVDEAAVAGFSPFGRSDGRTRGITAADAGILAGEPELRVLVPVQIDG
jgi:hypothetical protein